MRTKEEQENAYIKAVDDTLKEVLGETATRVVYEYLERSGMKKDEIPRKMEEFRIRLQEILGSAADMIYEMVKRNMDRSIDPE